MKLNWSKWLQLTKIRPTAAQKGPFWYCCGNKDPGSWEQCIYLSACVESVRTALAALVPLSRLPPRKSKALPLLLSLMRSWIETGWMTGWLLRVVSCSGVSAWGASPGSESGCSPVGACCGWVMVREGWAAPSLKWLCSSVLIYSHTLGTHSRREKLINTPKQHLPALMTGHIPQTINRWFLTLRLHIDILSSYILWPPMCLDSKEFGGDAWKAHLGSWVCHSLLVTFKLLSIHFVPEQWWKTAPSFLLEILAVNLLWHCLYRTFTQSAKPFSQSLTFRQHGMNSGYFGEAGEYLNTWGQQSWLWLPISRPTLRTASIHKTWAVCRQTPCTLPICSSFCSTFCFTAA